MVLKGQNTLAPVALVKKPNKRANNILWYIKRRKTAGANKRVSHRIIFTLMSGTKATVQVFIAMDLVFFFFKRQSANTD